MFGPYVGTMRSPASYLLKWEQCLEGAAHTSCRGVETRCVHVRLIDEDIEVSRWKGTLSHLLRGPAQLEGTPGWGPLSRARCQRSAVPDVAWSNTLGTDRSQVCS